MKKQEKLALVESALEDFYGDQQFASSLRESVLYSIHAGGKRIRPFLLLEVLESLQVAIKPAHAQVATALEMIHTGSLIHDDLPAMDDDDYRRGRLTNHKKFGSYGHFGWRCLILRPVCLDCAGRFAKSDQGGLDCQLIPCFR